MSKEKFVVSLGGSLIVPDTLDVRFLKRFKKILTPHFKDKQFYLVVGGGQTARQYQQAARSLDVSAKDLDWVGIQATRVNAQLVRGIFGRQASPDIFHSPLDCGRISRPVCVGGGWKPGWSTDYVAATVAAKLKVSTVINLSNVDYVYDKDPRTSVDARPLKRIGWPEMKQLVGGAWKPGAHTPFDPMASKLAAKVGLMVVMINGRKLSQLDNFLTGKPFKGSIIS